MKQLILCLLLSLVLTQRQQCEVYERPIGQLCEVMCEEHEYWNTYTRLCESCLEGEYFNPNTKRCEKDSLNDNNPGGDGPGGPGGDGPGGPGGDGPGGPGGDGPGNKPNPQNKDKCPNGTIKKGNKCVRDPKKDPKKKINVLTELQKKEVNVYVIQEKKKKVIALME